MTNRSTNNTHVTQSNVFIYIQLCMLFIPLVRLSYTNLLSIPYVPTSFGICSFSLSIWNSLPSALRVCASPDTFFSPQDPLFPVGLPIHLAPSSCASNSALADHCARLPIYLFTYYKINITTIFGPRCSGRNMRWPCRCCPLVSHFEYMQDGTDRETYRWTDKTLVRCFITFRSKSITHSCYYIAASNFIVI